MIAAAMFLPALPALGEAILQGVLGDNDIGKFVRLGLNAVVQGVTANEDIKQLNDEIQKMVDEQRAPTADEWKKYDDLIDDALRRARAAAGSP